MSLLLGNAPSATGTQPYQTVFTEWQSFGTYLVLISFYLIVFPIAGLTWLYRGYKILKIDVANELPIGEIFVLILFGVFSLQLFGAVIVDQLGILVGTNMQLRVLPIIGFISIILTASAVIRSYRWMSKPTEEESEEQTTGIITNGDFYSVFEAVVSKAISKPKAISLIFTILLVVSLVGFAGAATIKASSDPAISTNWIFSTQEEQKGMDWINTHTSEDYVWVGYNERIRTGYTIRYPEKPVQNTYDIAGVDLATHVVMRSSTMEELANAAGVPHPPVDDAHLIYSNGQTQFYRYDEYRTLDEFNDALRGEQE